MGQYLHHKYATDGSVDMADVRDALNGITDDDISISSPISAGAPEAATAQGDCHVSVVVDGHEGDWTKTSEDAFRAALLEVSGVKSLESSDGGYDPE